MSRIECTHSILPLCPGQLVQSFLHALDGYSYTHHSAAFYTHMGCVREGGGIGVYMLGYHTREQAVRSCIIGD